MITDRRTFLSAALVGLTRKAGRAIAGGFVNESQVRGHRLRDGVGLPAGRDSRRAGVVIVGGGMAGLCAGWRLLKRGFTDFVILEMEPEAGGNARFGENEVSAYPWGAHYVPVPGAAAGLVREIFSDLGVYDGTNWDERHLVHAPDERLFIHGRWQEGLEPQVGPTRRDRDQFARFAARMEALRGTGRFTIPMAASFDPAHPPPEDALSMAAWLDREGFDSPWLRWQVDYACRDDYGGLARDVSAWAGLLYFAARDADDTGPLTWPEGNGWIARRLLQRLGARVRTDEATYRVTRSGRGWLVQSTAATWSAEAVIVAAPLHVATRVVEGAPPARVTSSPWVTANLTLDRWPAERWFPVAWDNVLYDSPALGYVVATHQALRRHVPRTVWTYYWALAHQPAIDARRWLLAQEYGTLRDRILGDLSRAHPDIRECVSRVDIMRFGHAMVRPTPGLLSDPAWQAARRGLDRLFFAHSDLSALPLFEEAQARGVEAADRALAALSGQHRR
ncbi:amino oxidase [Luteitalea sp. TBR-22]|uniref:FAD-dependent oxidoreductase n=1 Tax=Luteitalea sp. TBR-22 TaxID=2802971 RepID=UPI001AF1E453|nr:FAD-dependent oxidoreductase [Luteitalea sp. TBR-22]BCS31790.1 amino oxidase [Luteitalea sp. TBR-22]